MILLEDDKWMPEIYLKQLLVDHLSKNKEWL